jgi:hypothetical protein
MAKAFRDGGWRTFTVDNHHHEEGAPSFNTDICSMTESDIARLCTENGGPQDAIHFGPPCTPRSKQHRKRTHYDGDHPVSQEAKRSDQCVAMCFKIIRWLLPRNPDLVWSSENPMYMRFVNLPAVRPYYVCGCFSKVHYSDYDAQFSKK